MKFSFITEVEHVVEAESLESLMDEIEQCCWDTMGYVNSEYAAYIIDDATGIIVKDFRTPMKEGDKL